MESKPVRKARLSQIKLDRMIWGKIDAKWVIRWWLKQSTIDCNNVDQWRSLVNDFNKQVGKNYTVTSLKQNWLKQIDGWLPEICKVSLEDTWRDDMKEPDKLRICTQRLRKAKELRRMNGLPDDMFNDSDVGAENQEPDDRVLYPNLRQGWAHSSAATQCTSNMSNVANPGMNANMATLQPPIVPPTSAPTHVDMQINGPTAGTSTGSSSTMPPATPVSFVSTQPLVQSSAILTAPLCDQKKSQTVAPKRKLEETRTYVLNPLGPTVGKLVKVHAVSPSFVADLTLARQPYFNGITFHILQSPGNNLDQLFGPKHEAFIKAHGGEIIQQQEQILPNTIVVASKDDSYNLEKLHELMQNCVIVYPEAPSLVVSDHMLEGGSHFEVSRFSEYVLRQHDLSISQSATSVVQGNLKTEPTEVTPPPSSVGTQVMDEETNDEVETQRLETDPIAKTEASIEKVDLQVMSTKACKKEDCGETLQEEERRDEAMTQQTTTSPGPTSNIHPPENSAHHSMPDLQTSIAEVTVNQAKSQINVVPSAIIDEYKEESQKHGEEAMLQDHHQEEQEMEAIKEKIGNDEAKPMKLQRGKCNNVKKRPRKQLALAFQLALNKPSSLRVLGGLVHDAYSTAYPNDPLKPTSCRNLTQKLELDSLHLAFEDLREEFELTPDMYNSLKELCMENKKQKKENRNENGPVGSQEEEREDTTEETGLADRN